MRSCALGIAAIAALSTGVAIAQVQEHEHVGPKLRTPPEGLTGEEAQAVELYRQVVPTVVTIFTQRVVRTPEGPDLKQGLGSGVLIAPEGTVLTAAHVVDGSDEILVKTQDGVMRPAELLFSESGADIALVRLVPPFPADLPHAVLGDSDRMAVGQLAYVAGAPLGLENSFSVGHISGFREFGRLYDGTILAEFIQTDAAINSGNSGGPVFDSRGEVIGIASRILTRSGGFEGLGFVVAINTAKELLMREDRGWMGIDAIFLDAGDLAALFHLDRPGGLLVQRVARGSPADRAGLRGGRIAATIGNREILLGGDLILRLGDQESCHSECLVRGRERLGDTDLIPIVYLRGGTERRTIVDVSGTRRNFLKGDAIP